MLTILNLFGRSPFAPLKSHMESVLHCVHKLRPLFEAVEAEDGDAVERIALEISEQEHLADLTKNDIRNHLPKSLFLPIDRGNLLKILSIQDSIADAAEDVAIVATLKHLQLLPTFKADFYLFLDKNIEAFNGVHQIIYEMNDLLESSFGGLEAERVKSMVDDVSFKEHEVDLIQRQLLRKFYREENMPCSSFIQWQKVFEALGAISNLSENLAETVRLTLVLK
jgi:uncharacterized protein